MKQNIKTVTVILCMLNIEDKFIEKISIALLYKQCLKIKLSGGTNYNKTSI